jgi:5-aminopentanamidase
MSEGGQVNDKPWKWTPVKVAAYQPLMTNESIAATVARMQERVAWCEANNIAILCCPEGALGGLADYRSRPREIAIHADGGQLLELLAPLASDRVTTIVGFTEIDRSDRLFNSAAVFGRGKVIGIYRKLFPAINKSVYSAGDQLPVFEANGVKFGIVICRDSTFREPAKTLSAQGARVLFIPTNSGLPRPKASPTIVAEARSGDVRLAREFSISIVRADVAGEANGLIAYGASGVVDARGAVLQTAELLREDFLVAELDLQTEPRRAAEQRIEDEHAEPS